MTLYNDVDGTRYLPSIQKALMRKKGVQKFPTNKEIELALEEKDVYNIQSKNRIYFLELLENHENREYVSIENNDITIEHIFPQTPDEVWYNKLDDNTVSLFRDKFLNTISNLTLSGNNGSLSNKYFLEKKSMNKDGRQQGYNFSRLWLNQYLREIDEWNLETLKTRYKLLLDRFYKIWEYPDIEIEEEIDTDQDYTIYNSPDPRYKKLDYFIWKDEKIVTDEISKMYYHVIKSLFEENPPSFYHQDIITILAATNNPEELRTPYQVSANYFIESNIDNNSKFRKLRALLTRVDCEEDLLINFSDLEPEDQETEAKDRGYWIEKAGLLGVEIVDGCLNIIHKIDKGVTLNYNQSYIGLAYQNRSKNFALFVPKDTFTKTSISLPDSNKWVDLLSARGFKAISIHKRNGRLKFRISKDNIKNDSDLLNEIFKESYEYRFNT
jgi:predicted transport protein